MTALRDGQRVPGRAVGRATGLAVAVLLVLGTQWLASPGSIAAASGCPQGSTMNVVAHEDDDLLFLSPDLLHDVQGGLCVRTVFVTAGDAGNDADYWMSREAGSEAAYAEMAGVADIWTANDAGVAGHPMPLLTLNGLPRISLVFMRLPDGNLNGSGFGAYGNQSLQKLWLGQIGSVAAVDGSSGYSKNGLTGVLAQLMDDYQPDTIRTQDEVGEFGDGDHSDHHATAYFALAAHQQLTFAHQFISYADYETSGRTQNVFGADLTEKQDAYFTYARFDNAVCGSLDSCSSSDYGAWLGRQYVLDVQGSSPPPPPPPSGTNVAPLATASASSQNASTGQTALKAVDGSSEGYPADYSHEW
ncbi:MAG: PIG-L family deacetylase, partial [Candidatus Limnocylindrales bacterium]